LFDDGCRKDGGCKQRENDRVSHDDQFFWPSFNTLQK
jgi:hypothetical protein